MIYAAVNSTLEVSNIMISEKLLDNWSFHWNGQSCHAEDSEPVTLPHDFMLVTPRTPDSPTGADYGYFQPCKGTYMRKIVKSSAEIQLLKFDGVMGLCEVFVNDEHVCFHSYGYTAFVCDIGKYLHDGENTLRVEVDASCQPASRWYTGAGLYRDVELLTSGKDRFTPWGVSVKILNINGDTAQVEFSADIVSSDNQTAEIRFNVPEIEFDLIRCTHFRAGNNHYSVKAVLHGVSLWSPETPVVYSLNAELATANCSDSVSVAFGIRTVVCDSERGLLLNGKPVKLYGSCNHHDNGIIGAASYRSAEERRVRILKENGFNAIRCAHNPPSSIMLDVCDRMGMLVIDEIFDCWNSGKRTYDYHLWFDKYAKDDITSMVVRDRNHPSVIMWSTGNEIYERTGKCDGYAVGKMIADTIRLNDDSRPLIHAFCGLWDAPEFNNSENSGIDLLPEQPDFWCKRIAPQAGNLDVLGYNYLTHRISKDERIFASHLFAVTESYPLDAVWIKSMIDSHKKLIGEFVWTGWDYFGETGIGHIVYNADTTPGWMLTNYPEHISNCGDFSICGFKKSASYYRDIAWNRESVRILSVDPDNFGRSKAISAWGFYDAERTWSYFGKEGRITEVQLYSTADKCELLLNGKSLGIKTPNEKGIALFETEYSPGRLEAIAYIGGEICGKDELFTVGEAASIKIEVDVTGKTGAADLIFLEIYLCDIDGNTAWTANDEVTVTVKGGKVIGTGSGKIDDEHDYTTNICRAYHGKLLAAVLPESNEVTVTVNTSAFEAKSIINCLKNKSFCDK